MSPEQGIIVQEAHTCAQLQCLILDLMDVSMTTRRKGFLLSIFRDAARGARGGCRFIDYCNLCGFCCADLDSRDKLCQLSDQTLSESCQLETGRRQLMK